MLLGVRFGRSVCNGDVGVMYPARDIAGWRLVAQLSRMKLWASNLLCFLQQKVWSPYGSCVLPHEHMGGFVMSYIGSLSLRLIAMSKLQFGSRLFLLLLFMETSG